MLVYELIQNSVDAGAKNVEFYEVTPGYIEALKDKLSPLAALANLNLLPDNLKARVGSYTHVIIADDGSGMSPDDVKTKLLRVGNTGKGKDKSGAYGIAKNRLYTWDGNVSGDHSQGRCQDRAYHKL